MNQRKLGNSGLNVAPLSFGGNVFGWTADQATSFQLLDACIEAGINLIDTADIYSTWVPGNKGGDSETIIGNWLAQGGGRREKILIATKVGMEMAPGKKGLKRDYILRSCDDSLKRLRTDRIDLYQSHQDDPNTPLEETLSAFGQLIKQGKVRAIGASNYTGERLAAAIDVSRKNGLPRYESLQPHYNLYERKDYETTLEPICLREGIGVISYYSLASGFLSGKYRSKEDLSKSARGARVGKYLDERGQRILRALDEVSKAEHATPAQVALAWLIARPSITAPIASATNLDQFKDLAAAMKLQMKPESIEKLTQASAY
jgi:aryl-alcohol dehydrogenase-like predicted oxidoreductase